jgi:hypothetical protein
MREIGEYEVRTRWVRDTCFDASAVVRSGQDPVEPRPGASMGLASILDVRQQASARVIS